LPAVSPAVSPAIVPHIPRTPHRLLLSALASALLLAFTTPAQGATYIFDNGLYAPGVTAPEPLLSGSTLQINMGGNKFFSAVSMTNQSGTVVWSGDTLYLQNGAAISNQSLWEATGDNTLANNGGVQPSFVNSGVFRKSAGAGATTVSNIGFSNSGTIDAQSGTIVFSGGDATFNAGSSFTGAGITAINNSASFNGAFSSSNLALNNGVYNGTGAKISGAVSFTGGYLQSGWEVAAGQQLNFNAGGNKFLNAATLVNNGTINGLTTDAVYFQNGSAFTNNGLHDLQDSNTLANNGGAMSTYTNSSGATLRVASGKTVNVSNITFSNDGATLTANGTLNFNGGLASFNAGTLFNGSGVNAVNSNANFNGSFTSSNLLLANGVFNGTAAVLNGTVDFTGGYLQGGWTIAAGQVLHGLSGGNKFLNAAAVSNLGTVEWNTTDALYFQNGSSFANSGTFDMLTGATLANNGGAMPSMTNTGLLHVASGQGSVVGNVTFVSNGGKVTADGTLTFNGGLATFNNGSVFDGAGSVNIANNASFVDSFTASNLVLSNGTYTGGDGSAGSKALANGSIKFTGGYFGGNWKLASGQTLMAQSGGNKFLNGAQFDNSGSLLWQTTDALYLQNGSTLDNNGLIAMQANTSFVNNGGAMPILNNNGTLRVETGIAAGIGNLTFNHNNGATIQVDSGASLNLYGGLVNINDGSKSTGSGVLMITNNASFNGSFTTSNLSLRNGAYTGAAAVLHGTAELSGGFMQGGWTVASGATLDAVNGGNKYINAGSIDNQGTWNWQATDALYFQNSAQVTNKGTLNLSSDASFVYNGGAVGSFVNTGLIAKTAGAGTSTIGNNLGFDNQGVVDVQTGIIRLPDNFTNNGTLMGNGAFSTNLLTNAGHVAPGASPGTLTINGNYMQAAGGFFDVDLSTLASSDLLLINGTAALNGGLDLNCYAGCHFAVGDKIVILDATGQLDGSFSGTLQMHGFSSGAFSVIYDRDQDRVLLEVTEAVAAAAVPEPSTYAMLAAGLLLLAGVRRHVAAGTRSASVQAASTIAS
jgi:hypothetical protein